MLRVLSRLSESDLGDCAIWIKEMRRRKEWIDSRSVIGTINKSLSDPSSPEPKKLRLRELKKLLGSISK